MIRRPPRSTLFPYTTLFRSLIAGPASNAVVQVGDQGVLVVDTMREQDADALLAEIRKLAGNKPIRYVVRSEEHTSELQSPCNLVCRLLLEKKKKKLSNTTPTASIESISITRVAARRNSPTRNITIVPCFR